MLSSMLKDHLKKQKERKEEIDRKRAATSELVHDVTNHLVNHLNDGVAQAYLNQHKLDCETKQLHLNVAAFCNRTNQWLSLMKNLDKSVKELGDVENWAKSIESDLKVVSSALEYVYKVGPPSK